MPLLVRWLHLLAAITWIGGMLFLTLVLMPSTRGMEDEVLRRRLVRDVGRRFRTVGWAAIGVLVATGLLNIWMSPGLLSSPRLHGKLGLVALALILSAFHDFVLGPRVGAPGAGPRLRVWASWIARLNLLVVLAAVALGLALLR